MVRSRVDFPDPDRPSNATISPPRRSRLMSSSTRRGSPPRPSKLLHTWATLTSTSSCRVMRNLRRTRALSHREPAFGQRVQPPPEQPVHPHYVEAHNNHADKDVSGVAVGGRVFDVGAQPGR